MAPNLCKKFFRSKHLYQSLMQLVGSPRGQTPLMQQYYRIKDEHPGTLLLFRVGDFYETFEDDALKASEILGIVLTKRANGAAQTVPLAGFPYHALENHLPKLINAGLRVAICEQLEDPKLKGKLVKRGVVEVVTPGVSLRDQLLNPKRSHFLVALHFTPHCIGVACVDASTGTFEVSETTSEKLDSLLQTLQPAEVLVDRSGREHLKAIRARDFAVTRREDWIFTDDFARTTLLDHFGTHSLKGFGVEDQKAGLVAAGAVMHYLSETQQGRLTHIQRLQRKVDDAFMLLDQQTRRNLELTAPLYEGQLDGTLVQILDYTHTAMGSRLLRQWLYHPLRDVTRIQHRLDAVEALVRGTEVCSRIQQCLKRVCDVERVVAQTCTQRASPRALLALALSLQQIPELLRVIGAVHCDALDTLEKRLDACPEVQSVITRALEPGEGQLFRTGYSKDLDELRTLSASGKSFIEHLQKTEIERTGIPSLKVGFNKVFGYYIEITNTHRDKVPAEYIRRQTLVNAERFVTPELKEYEARILSAEEQMAALEAQLLRDLRTFVAQSAVRLQKTASALATLDCFASLATVAVRENYVRPQLDVSTRLRIVNGRHPVVEQAAPGAFIPNSVDLDTGKRQIYIITGPNMAGKSVVLRQVGLIVLLAQVGAFVPADEASIGVVDRIFTRVGASDNLVAGESTFLVEMNETANILNNATPHSLILLDEVGRGTSTFDGLSIAWALVEYLHENARVAARTLFATHYHELNELAKHFDRVCNYRIQVQEHEGKIVFLRKLVPGAADHSYGIEVARMAGLPPKILRRAREVLQDLETQPLMNSQIAPSRQMSLFQEPDTDELREALEKINPDGLTPIEALLALAELKRLANS